MAVETGIQFFGGSQLEVFDWDTLIMAGEVWPGIATVSGKGVSRKLDIKRRKGSDGATMKDEGADPAEFTIELLIYNRQDWDELQRLLPLIQPRRSGGVRNPVQILHPVTQTLSIDNVYIKSIKAPSLDKAKQWLTLTIDVIEYFPEPKPVKKGAGTANGAGTNKKDDVNKNGNANEPEGQDPVLASPVAVAEEGIAAAANNIAEQAIANTFPDGA